MTLLTTYTYHLLIIPESQTVNLLSFGLIIFLVDRTLLKNCIVIIVIIIKPLVLIQDYYIK